MKAENKMIASVGGIAVLAAVVIGGSIAAASHSGSTTPAGDQVTAPSSSVPLAAPIGSTPAASPTSVAPSTKRAASKRAAVVNPGDPVTDPTTTTQASAGAADPADPPLETAPGVVDEAGVTRVPHPGVPATHPPMPKGEPTPGQS